jgi:flagellar protein FlbD
MISLTRLSGSVFVLNADLIERLDCTPDTVITLVDGKKYVVAESMDQVVDAIRAYRGLLIATSQLPPEPAPPTRPHLAPVTELSEAAAHQATRQEAD